MAGNGGTSPSPQLFFETVNAFQKSEALKAAIELDLFTAISEGKTTPPSIAERCKIAERGARILCDYLTIHGFLTKEDGQYQSTLDSATFLNRNRRRIWAQRSSSCWRRTPGSAGRS